MQEEKELNNGNDHSRFMPPSIPNDNKETTLNSQETTANQEINNRAEVAKETTEFTITDIDSLANPVYLVTEKVSYTTENTKPESTPQELEITEVQIPSQEPILVEQQDYHNKYSSEPYQNYQTINTIPPTTRKENNVFGIIGFSLAVFSWILVLVPIIAQLTWILGLVFSIIGVFKKPRELAMVGLVISLIGFAICIFLITTLGPIEAFKTVFNYYS